MTNYVVTTEVKAEPMSRGDYNLKRGWVIPKNEEPSDEGYLVENVDGHISWVPKETFERYYKKVGEPLTHRREMDEE